MPIIDCKKIASNILSTIKGGNVGIICNNSDSSAQSYFKELVKTTQKFGITVYEETYGSHWLAEGVNRLIDEFNQSSDIDGIILISPQPQHYECIKRIFPNKQIEGNDFDTMV